MENYEYSGFYIEKPVGNNVFSYDKRENKSIYVPKLINGTLNDVRLGNEVVFNEVDENKEIKQKDWRIWSNMSWEIKRYMCLTIITMHFIFGQSLC